MRLDLLVAAFAFREVAEHRRQLQLGQPPVGDIAHIRLDVGGGHAFDLAHVEGQVDKAFLQLHHGLGDIDDVVAHRFGDAAGFLVPGMVQLGDALAVQAFVAHRPGHDLSHAVHLVVAREVQQHGEAGEQRHAFGEGAEHGERPRHIGAGSDAERVHVIGLGTHFAIVAEGLEFGLGHAQRLQQQRIGVDMHRLHVGERGHHHLHRERLKDRDIALEIVVTDLDVRLGEEAEDLCQQSPLVRRHPVRRPVLEIAAKRHLLTHPVRLLLSLPELVGPGIAIDVVSASRFQQTDFTGANQRTRIEFAEQIAH